MVSNSMFRGVFGDEITNWLVCRANMLNVAMTGSDEFDPAKLLKSIEYI